VLFECAILREKKRAAILPLDPEGEITTTFRKAGKYIFNDTAQDLRRPESSFVFVHYVITVEA
jgi:hypothetical protein